MKLKKLSLAVASVIGAGFAADAMAMNLYVDTKTQQIFAEPGAGRVMLGSFEKVEDQAAQKADIQKIKEDMAAKTNELKALDEHMQAAEETKLKMGADGVSFESKDGNFKMKLIGRLQADAQTNISGNDTLAPTQKFSDGAGIRRARLGVEGTFYKDFAYKVEYDFAKDSSANNAGLTDAYINYTGFKDFGFQVGQFKEPYGMEIQTSNRFIPFIERSMMSNAFSDSQGTYQTGFGVNYAQPRWAAKAALQSLGPDKGWDDAASNNGKRQATQGDTSWQVAGRLTGMPWFEDKNHFLHLGASGMRRDTNQNTGSLTISSVLGGNVDRTTGLSTAAFTGATLPTSITRVGAETAAVYGPLAVMAEYTQLHLDGKAFSNRTGEAMDGYYVYSTYMLTGESRAYKAATGSWDRIKPARNFDGKGGWGAWELAVGFDALNLKDGTAITGGTAKLGKFGVNWYPNSRFKVMANLVQVLDVNTAGQTNSNYNNKDMTMVEMRGQVDF